MLGWTVGSRHRFETVSPDRLFDWFSNDAEFTTAEALDGPRIEVEVAAVVRHEADLSDDGYPGMLFPEGFARAHADEIAHIEPFALIQADPARLDDVRQRVDSIVAPVGMTVSDAPALGEAAPAIIPTVRVEVTTLRIAAAVAAGCRIVRRRPGARASCGDCGQRGLGARCARHDRPEQLVGKWLGVAPAVLVGAVGVPVVAWLLSGTVPRWSWRGKVEPAPGLRLETIPVVVGTVATAAATLALAVVMARSASRSRRIQQATGARPRRRRGAQHSRSERRSSSIPPAPAGRVPEPGRRWPRSRRHGRGCHRGHARRFASQSAVDADPLRGAGGAFGTS